MQGYNANVRNIKCSPSVLMYVFADSWYDRYTQHEIDQRLDMIQRQPASRNTIAVLAEHGLSNQAARLGISGSDGYPEHAACIRSATYSSGPSKAYDIILP